MVNSVEIKSVILLTHLNDEMLAKVANLATIETMEAKQYVFKEGDFAEKLYAILEGKVALELDKSNSSTLRIQDVTQNHVFGISALVDTDNKKCISHARALTALKLVSWKAAELEKLFHQDSELGFVFMKRVTSVLKDRWQIKNAQLAQYN